MYRINSDKKAGVEVAAIVIVLLVACISAGAVWAVTDGGRNTVTYNANNMANESKTHDDCKIVEECMFSNNGYIFFVWEDEKGTVYYPGDKIESDLNLFAIWTSSDAKNILKAGINAYGDGKMGPFTMSPSSMETSAMATGPNNIQTEHAQLISIIIMSKADIEESYNMSMSTIDFILETYKASGIPITEIKDTFGLDKGRGLYFTGLVPTSESGELGPATSLIYFGYSGGTAVSVGYSMNVLNDFSLDDSKTLISALTGAI